MRKTYNTEWVEVKEVIPSFNREEGVDVDELRFRCKYVKIISECEFEGYYVIPINGLKRTNKGLWAKKWNLLAEVSGVNFTEVKSYLNKNKKIYDGYIPEFVDIRLNKHKNKRAL